MNKNEVFISYSWGGESENLAQELEDQLISRGINVTRDKKSLGYKGRISDFMKRIGSGKAILLILSDKYFKSEFCMFELMEIYRNSGNNPDEFIKPIIPILIDNSLTNRKKRSEYLKYWKDKRNEYDLEIKELGIEALSLLVDDVELNYKVLTFYGPVIKTLYDLNLLNPSLHRNSDFQEIYDEIFSKFQSDPEELEVVSTRNKLWDETDLPEYIELRPFQKKDQNIFFGRNDKIHEILEFLKKKSNQQWLQIEGVSGSGKSSIIYAGVLPRLNNWNGEIEFKPPLEIIPGESPFEAFLKACQDSCNFSIDSTIEDIESDYDMFQKLIDEVIPLPLDNPNIHRLIILDQFEQVLASSKNDKTLKTRIRFTEFIRKYLEHDHRNRLITVIRHDWSYLMFEKNWGHLGETLNKLGRIKTVVPPDLQKDLSAIIVKPAELKGFTVDENLIEKIRHDLSSWNSTGWLPILSIILTQLNRAWKDDSNKEKKRHISLDKYEQINGRDGAIQRLIQNVNKSIESKKTQIDKIFGLLVKLDVQGRATQKRVRIEDIDKELIPALKVLENQRLVLNEGGVVHLIHDILFEAWDSLRNWIDKHKNYLEGINIVEYEARIQRFKQRIESEFEDMDDFRVHLVSEYGSSISDDARNNITKTPKTSAENSKTFVDAILKGEMRIIKNHLNAGNHIYPEDLESLQHLDFYSVLFPNRKNHLLRNKPHSLDEEFNKKLSKECLYYTVGKNLKLVHFASLCGNIQVLEELKSLGASLKEKSEIGTTPLHLAAYNGQLQTIKWLIKNISGSTVEVINQENDDGGSAIVWALLEKHVETAKYLLSLKEINITPSKNKSYTALHGAAQGGDFELFKTISDKDLIHINHQTEDGWTPLHFALRYGSDEIVKELLNKENICINIQTEDGWTPLHFVARYRNKDLTKLFLTQKGIEVNHETVKNKYTPLYLSTFNEDFEVFKSILDHDQTDPNIRSENKHILHLVIEKNREDFANLLLNDPKVDKTIKNEEGETPFNLVIRLRKNKIIALFEKYGYEISTSSLQTVVRTEQGEFQDIQTLSEDEFIAKSLTMLSKPELTDWQLDPIIDGDWSELDENETREVIAAIRTKIDNNLLSSSIYFNRIRRLPLLFYKNSDLFELEISKNHKLIGHLVIIKHPDGIVVLNGTSPSIHFLNSQVPLDIDNERKAFQYFDFFCAAVHGEESAFRVLNSAKRLLLEKDDIEHDIDFQAYIKNPNLKLTKDKSYWETQCTIKYSNAIFNANFKIQKGGMVEMLDDEPLVADLDASNEVFKDGVRTVKGLTTE
ncbi:nSTAND1 domain-containing NTPase [Lunatibacter salilacus]|uniref:nSTAND1 domain-containing NTPase n=1 Tax=Lunatibacter salilacus TaxID=2483804 RepID=UPI00131BF841|nr:ankyrin repeat domain-containing protein [Lunatibacter salilacus]